MVCYSQRSQEWENQIEPCNFQFSSISYGNSRPGIHPAYSVGYGKVSLKLYTLASVLYDFQIPI